MNDAEKPFNPWREFWHPFIKNVAWGWALITLIMILVTVHGAMAVTNDARLYLSLDQNSSTVTDLSGYGNDGTVSGATYIDPAKVEGGYSFDSTNDAIIVADDADYFNGDTLSYGGWFNYAAFETGNPMAQHNANASARSGYNIWYYTVTSDFYCQMGDGVTWPKANVQGTGVATGSTNTWYHVVCVKNGSTQQLYVNGVLSGSSSVSFTIADPNVPLAIGKDISSGTYDFNGRADEVFVYTRALSAAEIGELYNSGSGYNPYAIATPTVNLMSPVDNDHTNDVPLTFEYNATTDVGSMNCSLYLNGSLNETHTGLGNVTDTFNKSLADGSYSWFVSCADANGETNSTTRTVVIDTISPDWTVNPSNFFATDNSTVLNPLVTGDVYNYNLTLQDAYIFAYNVTIFNSTGGIMTTLQVTNSTAEEVNITSSVNMSSWPSANYTVQLYAEDDHTAKRIPEYAKTYTADSVEFVTDTKNQIRIRNEQGNLKSIRAEKEVDRYTWNFEPNNNRKTWSFIITASEPLYDRSELWGYPGFVTGKNWVDFNVPEQNVAYQVQMLDEYSARITITRSTNSRLPLQMRSLGGLNIVNETYSFEVLRTPPQSTNLTATETGTDYIYLNWTDHAPASGATLYRNDNVIATLTTPGYNDTGLVSGASYTYRVWSFYNETGTLIYNTTTASNGEIIASTTFNGTLAVEVRNAVTDTIITGDLFFINLIGSMANQTVNTTTGLAGLTNITSDNYTVRVTGVGWGSRDIYTTILQNQSENVVARLLNDSTRTGGVISIVNTNGEQQSGVVVKLLRYLPNQNAYEVVQAITTVGNGQNTMDGQLYDGYYKFIVQADGQTYFSSTNPETLFPGADGLWRRTFTINRDSNYYQSIQNRNTINTTFTNNTVGNDTTLTFTWNDAEGIVSRGCLQTRGRTGASWEEWTQTCANGAAGSVFITLNETNTQRYQYAAVLDYSTAWSDWTAYAGYLDPSPIYDFGVLGAFLGTALLGGLILLFSYSAVAVMIIGAAGTLLLSLLTFLPFTTTFIIGLAFISIGIGVYFMRS